LFLTPGIKRTKNRQSQLPAPFASTKGVIFLWIFGRFWPISGVAHATKEHKNRNLISLLSGS